MRWILVLFLLCSCGAWNDTLSTLNKASDSLAKASDTVAKVQATVGEVMGAVAKAQAALEANKAVIDTNKDDKMSISEIIAWILGIGSGGGIVGGLAKALGATRKELDELWERTHVPVQPPKP